MLFNLIVNLYASRVILQHLGITDFGIYNIVGGFVAMFSFLNTSLSNASQRFLTYELGKNKDSGISKLFIMLINIHIIISCVLVLLIESLGQWFFVEKMNIPDSRSNAALLVFHFSAVTLFMSIMSTPYNALIIAHENMKAYAYIDMLNTLVKLCVIFAIPHINSDKLIIYAFLLCLVSVFICSIYYLYCHKLYSESRYRFIWDKEIFTQVISFSGWVSFSAVGSLAKKNGLNILINMFVNVIANAAVGIAYQVNQAILNFTNSFQTAFVPQLIKSYAEGNLIRTRNIVFSGAKICSLLLMILSIPVLLETNYILKIWLSDFPQFTPWLIRLVLLESIIRSISFSMNSAIRASARIRTFEIINNLILFVSLIICYFILRCYHSVYFAFIIEVLVAVISTAYTIRVCSKRINFKINEYLCSVIIRVLFSYVVVFLLSLIPHYLLCESATRLIFVCVINIISSFFIVYTYSLNKKEKDTLKNLILKKRTV